MHTTTLDLGCGKKPKNPFNATKVYGIDLFEDESIGVTKRDLTVEKIPHRNEFFNFVTAFDFIEHVPRIIYMPEKRNPFIELMNEISRVLSPGGLFLSFTPAYPNIAAFSDPTHVNIITEQTFPLYFDSNVNWAGIYGYKGSLRMVRQEWRGVHLQTIMKKV